MVTAIVDPGPRRQTVRSGRWQRASSDLTGTLLARTTGSPLDAVVRFAMRAAAADMATYTAPLTARTGRVAAAAGDLAGRADAIVDLDRTLAGRVVRTGRPVLIDADAGGPDTGDLDDLPGGVRAVIGVPVPGADRSVRGALVVARTRDQDPFTSNDRDQLTGYAEHAGGALDLDRAREDHETLRRLEDRERIAADLHNQVIQQQFTIGMGLQGLVGQLTRPEQRTRVHGYIDTLDDTIRGIRNTVYRLRREPEASPTLRERLLAGPTGQTDLTGRDGAAEPLDQLCGPPAGDGGRVRHRDDGIQA